LGLIEKIGILRDQINLIEIRGQIARKLKFWGQLRVKLIKFKIKDQSAKGAKL
jgi:hypothetical protein